MWLVLNVCRNVATYVRARDAPQIAEIPSEVINAGGGPPEADGVCVIRKLLAIEQVISFKKSLRGFQLLAGVVVAIVEVGDFVVNRARCGPGLFRGGLGNYVDWSDVALRVVAEVYTAHQTGISQRPLETRVWLPQNK